MKVPSTTAVSQNDFILETHALCKRFGGFNAVNEVDLQVQRGHIHVLIGPNGAGKTTCFNLLTKVLVPTSGTITFQGRDITAEAPADIALLGMVRSFQLSAIFPSLSVLDNVRVALQRPLGLSYKFWRSATELDQLNGRAFELLADVGLARQADRPPGSLSYGRKRALEIATTLALDPELLLLDEPTSGMGLEDIGLIAELIRRIAKSRTVLMVEHNLAVVADLADHVTVLAQGEILAQGSYDDVANDAGVMAAYIGKKRHA
ncbi:MAG: L-cystine import ATP-binding protein TcyC [Hyphomicrobiales bacterium]|jgi:branched-chain amino acid transport system ATP-binding protein|nr:L-cystine import ATP-binding protein TcyC [Hyphomicrobiales bacterium]